jgi:hypothetical protein
LILGALHLGETHLAEHLTAVAKRHPAEHEISHVATDLALWSREHVQRLAEAGRHYGLDLGGAPRTSGTGVLALFRQEKADATGQRSEPGLLLLRDLRELHLAATENSLYWEMLAQTAQAAKEDRLLALASSCHPQGLRQMRWLNTMIKNVSPQILTSL